MDLAFSEHNLLGYFVTNTIGVKHAMPAGKSSEFSVRVETISQIQTDVGIPSGD